MKWTSFKDIVAWKMGMRLVDSVYAYTSSFPVDERFGLTSQMRRAAVSIPSNIAEGAARKGPAQMRLFLSYSLGSLAELETQMEISINQNFAPDHLSLSKEIIECRKVIYGLLNSLKNNTRR
jgi:four helix bundle protein